MKPAFSGGPNIAIKVPSHQYDATVAFYRDVLGLTQLIEKDDSVAFEFGANRLWIDRVGHLSKSEIWLEVTTPRLDDATRHLAENKVSRRDEIEALPAEIKAFWVSDPANNIVLVEEPADSPDPG